MGTYFDINGTAMIYINDKFIQNAKTKKEANHKINKACRNIENIFKKIFKPLLKKTQTFSTLFLLIPFTFQALTSTFFKTTHMALQQALTILNKPMPFVLNKFLFTIPQL